AGADFLWRGGAGGHRCFAGARPALESYAQGGRVGSFVFGPRVVWRFVWGGAEPEGVCHPAKPRREYRRGHGGVSADHRRVVRGRDFFAGGEMAVHQGPRGALRRTSRHAVLGKVAEGPAVGAGQQPRRADDRRELLSMGVSNHAGWDRAAHRRDHAAGGDADHADHGARKSDVARHRRRNHCRGGGDRIEVVHWTVRVFCPLLAGFRAFPTVDGAGLGEQVRTDGHSRLLPFVSPIRLARMPDDLQTAAEALGLNVYRRHIFLCADQTEPQCAPKEKGLEAWEYLKKRLKELKLAGPQPL